MLEKFEDFSLLQTEEKKKITVFYLLLPYLPEVVEEVVKEN